jgi:hypothetical protein
VILGLSETGFVAASSSVAGLELGGVELSLTDEAALASLCSSLVVVPASPASTEVCSGVGGGPGSGSGGGGGSSVEARSDGSGGGTPSSAPSEGRGMTPSGDWEPSPATAGGEASWEGVGAPSSGEIPRSKGSGGGVPSSGAATRLPIDSDDGERPGASLAAWPRSEGSGGGVPKFLEREVLASAWASRSAAGGWDVGSADAGKTSGSGARGGSEGTARAAMGGPESLGGAVSGAGRFGGTPCGVTFSGAAAPSGGRGAAGTKGGTCRGGRGSGALSTAGGGSGGGTLGPRVTSAVTGGGSLEESSGTSVGGSS